ncbi:MAG: ArsA family ATPase [Deltaproteobacteria bacterium]|nr:ArsA family ATPase [Deltaproteobacteria bacterium]
MTLHSIRHLLNKKVLILLGAGGVGKTSCSLGLALSIAQTGARVGLISIDPAKRLAAAIGLRSGEGLKEILRPEGSQGRGKVFATMLEPQEVFDEMVRRHAKSEKAAERILCHPLYEAASRRLAGPAEYMALARLRDMINNPELDMVIVDTPPDQQALDFLSKPDILASFRENKVMHWLVLPIHMAGKFGASRLFSVSEKLMGGLARITGIEALKKMAEFLMLLEQVIDGFHKASEGILETLRSQKTAFLLVSACHSTSLRTARHLATQLHRQKYPLAGIFFNRCLPDDIRASLKRTEKQANPHPWLKSLQQRRKMEDEGIESFLSWSSGSMRPGLLLRIPEQQDCIHSREALCAFSAAFNLDVQN